MRGWLMRLATTLGVLMLLASTGCDRTPPLPTSVPDAVVVPPKGEPNRGHARVDPAAAGSVGLPGPFFRPKAGVLHFLEYSPDGRWLATGGHGEATLKVWDVATGDLRHELKGHTGEVRDVAFSPDGGTLVSVSTGSDSHGPQAPGMPNRGGGEVLAWDVLSGQPVRAPIGRASYPRTVAFDRGGETLLVAGHSYSNSEVYIWDFPTRKKKDIDLFSVVLNDERGFLVQGAAFLGKNIVLGRGSGEMDQYLRDTGRNDGKWEAHRGGLDAMTVSDDDEWLATGGFDRTVRVLRLDGSGRTWLLRGIPAPIRSVAISPKGRFLAASGFGERDVYVWDLARVDKVKSAASASRPTTTRDAKLLPDVFPDGIIALPPATGPDAPSIAGLAFFPTGDVLAAAVGNRVVTWDVSDPSKVMKPYVAVESDELASLEAHKGPVYRVEVSPDGKLLASSGSDGLLKVWDIARRAEVRAFPGNVSTFEAWAFSPDGKAIATGAGNVVENESHARITIWPLGPGTIRHATVPFGPRQADRVNAVRHLAYSPDGSLLLSINADGAARFWDPSALKETGGWLELDRPLVAGRFSPDGKQALLAMDDGEVAFYRLSPPEVVARLPVPEGRRVLAFRPGFGGRRFAVATRPGGQVAPDDMAVDVTILDVEKADTLRSLSLRSAYPFDLAFSPDGSRLAVTSTKNEISILDVASGRVVAAARGHEDRVNTLAFTPDGQALVSGSKDRTLRYWDAATGSPLKVLHGHYDAILIVRVVPDGSIVVTGGQDQTVRLWKGPKR